MHREEKVKENRLDHIPGSGIEVACSKEDASAKNCQNPKAHRRCNATEGFQYRIVTRLACLTNRKAELLQLCFKCLSSSPAT